MLFVLLTSFTACWSDRAASRTTAWTVRYSTTSVVVGSQTIPMAVWCPEPLLPKGVWQPAEAYPYTVDVGRIAAKLKVGWLTWLPSRTFTLDRARVASAPQLSTAARQGLRPGGDALIFAHGFLGSPYDMAHACEALASDGFVVKAARSEPLAFRLHVRRAVASPIWCQKADDLVSEG